MAYDAVLRNLAVIGEAARSLSAETQAGFPETPWPSIVGLRNIVVHECFRVRPDLVLGIVNEELAPLAVAIRAHVED